jgi:hypothetical protein
MDPKTLEQKIAYLEFINDQLSSEILYVDKLLKIIGFPEGLTTIKDAAKEVIDENGFYEEENFFSDRPEDPQI